MTGFWDLQADVHKMEAALMAMPAGEAADVANALATCLVKVVTEISLRESGSALAVWDEIVLGLNVDDVTWSLRLKHRDELG